MRDLSVYRATDSVKIDPYTFDAGQGPGMYPLDEIMALAKASGCTFDAGWWGGPMFLKGLPQDDAELEALLELAQVQ